MSLTQKHSFLAFTHDPPKKHNSNNSPSLSLALGIPEILERILSFVVLHNQQRTAKLVCKQWYSICRDLVPVSYTWILRLTINNHHNLYIKNDETQAIQAQVSSAHTLIIQVNDCAPSPTASTQRSISWTAMMNELSRIVQECHNQRVRPRLKTLHLKEGILEDFGIQLPQLPHLITLTTLRIDSTVQWDIIHLFTILKACQNLEDLSIKPTLLADTINLSTHFTAAQSSTITSRQEDTLIYGDQALSKSLRLQTCSLYDLVITLPALTAFLKASPRLSKLILARCDHLVRQGQDIILNLQDNGTIHSSSSIIRLVGIHSPKLKVFHLSMRRGQSQSYGLSGQDVVTMLQTFPHMDACNLTDYEFDLPLLKTPYLAVVNRVTTLNIFPIQREVREGCHISVREILCTFEHLIHFRAPNSVYYLDDMDLNDVKEPLEKLRSRYYYSRARPRIPTNDPVIARQYVWVCRGLKTLHMALSFRAMVSYSPETSLIIYGFLSRMCPRLQELYLKRWWIDLSFKAGLSLLTRLQDLERVTFALTYRPELDEEGFSWMQPVPSRFAWGHLIYPLSHYRTRTRIKKEYKGVPPSTTTAGSEFVKRGRELGIDLSKVGYIDDLLEWMDERYGTNTTNTTTPMARSTSADAASRRNDLRYSLPNLQSFRVEFSEGQDADLQSFEDFVGRIRPEVDFQLRLCTRNIFYDRTLLHY
ncbi:hypothetical protein BGZ95_007549 [Linnemannia exigua]|uniref:F-box domain-containing protein n=1 Tax=Linnemannia exigua TaxID=604196 RepID=A0AAD4DF41_9FUNG|nr:hypothetical protein BGZ95_007549 [Linnemannia exigua]